MVGKIFSNRIITIGLIILIVVVGVCSVYLLFNVKHTTSLTASINNTNGTNTGNSSMNNSFNSTSNNQATTNTQQDAQNTGSSDNQQGASSSSDSSNPSIAIDSSEALSIGESAMPGANSYDVELTFIGFEGFEVYAYYDTKTEIAEISPSGTIISVT